MNKQTNVYKIFPPLEKTVPLLALESIVWFGNAGFVVDMAVSFLHGEVIDDAFATDTMMWGHSVPVRNHLPLLPFAPPGQTVFWRRQFP
jgi:hypothetical protein